MDTSPHEHINHPTLGNLARPMNGLSVAWRVVVERADVLTVRERRVWLLGVIADAERLKTAAQALVDATP
jgi:hypothetical protein